MATYLNKFLSIINDVQAKQLTSLLIDQNNQGAIQNLDQLRSYLSTLTDKITSTISIPTLKLFLGQENQIIDSETYNFMLDRIRDDLDSIFAEIDNIDNLINTHINLINNGVLKAIQLGIDSLENKVSTYEFLASSRTGLDNAQSNTFKTTQSSRINRSDPDVGIYFLDPKTNLIIDSDVTLDTVAEEITLGSNNLQYVVIKSVEQLFDETTKQSADLVSLVSNDIQNIIDGASGTYWTYSILQEEQQNAGVKLKLLLNLSGINTINFIEIEPASIFNMELLSIDYIDSNSSTKTIPNIEQTINKNIRINFGSIITDTLILTFNQLHAAVVEYENKDTNNNFNLAANNLTSDVNIKNLTDILQAQIKSSNLLTTAFMLDSTPTPGKQVKYFDYEIGFDNIRVGLSEFANTSIFVSGEMTVNNLSQIALKSTEVRPVESAGIVTYESNSYNTDSLYTGSIEYYCVIKNYDDQSNIISVNTVPIAPIELETIYHERLILTQQVNSVDPNVGQLSLYVRLGDTVDNLIVYQDGVELEFGPDWYPEAYPYTNNLVPPTGIPNRTAIRITNPKENSYYTVTYKPIISTTRTDPNFILNLSSFNAPGNINLIDLVGDGSIRIGQDNILYVSNNAAKSTVALMIILRRNTRDPFISPAVKDYVLLTSTSDPKKFKQ